uniref:Zinc finger/thioredoxin putative domain-containing protein n=1 Tax=candidate division WOR-3 bacterium TaxID=2052148 RepID=A0A7V3ZSY5_UNCW3
MEEYIIIECPFCKTKYKLPKEKAKPGIKARCKKCGNIFPIAAIEEKKEERKYVPPKDEEERKLYEKAKRLARILAKDITNYYREKWEMGLKEGNLKEILKEEIKKSWEYYCEKIPEEIRKKTNFFEEAFNEIVGKGQKIF